jgi:hypothetical protein
MLKGAYSGSRCPEIALGETVTAAGEEIRMDQSRCPRCKRRLIAMTDRTSRTSMVCLKCDNVDPMKTEAAKWAASSLAEPKPPGRKR